jgi:uncharacterized protein YodC (DUF2158 family)
MNSDDGKKIEIGDVVKLKSGGPPMTVGSVSGDIVTAVWFPDDFTVSSREFLVDMLLLRVEPKPD